MIFFVTHQLNISKFLPPQIQINLYFLLIETKLHQSSKFLLMVCLKHEGLLKLQYFLSERVAEGDSSNPQDFSI